MAFPDTHDTHSLVADANPDGSGGNDVLAENVNWAYTLLDDMQTYYGISTDEAAAEGSHESRIKLLEDTTAAIYWQTTQPVGSVAGNLWIDSDDATLPLKVNDGDSFEYVGANALRIRGLAIDTGSPSDGQVLRWSAADSELQWGDASEANLPFTTQYDLVMAGPSPTFTPTRLALGTEGQILGVSGSALAYINPPYLTKPGTLNVGDLFVWNGTTVTRLQTDATAGRFLRNNGTGVVPTWADLPSAPAGSAIPAPASSVAGNLLYFADPDWDNLDIPASPTTSGYVLGWNPSTELPEWTLLAASGDMDNPMTDVGDLIYGTTGGDPVRLGIGASGQLLRVVGGAPAWRSDWHPMTTQDDLIIGGTVSGGVAAPARLAKGSNGQVLTMVSGHVAWANNAAGFADPLTTRGDLIYRDSSNTTARLPRGTAGQVLTTDGTDVMWDDPSGGGGSAGYFAPFTAPPNAASWSWLNQGSSTVVDSGGGVTLRAPSSLGTQNLRFLYKNAPSTPYTITVCLAPIWHQENFQSYCLMFYDAVGGKLTGLLLNWDSTTVKIAFHKYNSASSLGTAYFQEAADHSWRWFRLKNDGTNLSIWMSTTGYADDWLQFNANHGVTDFLANAPNKVGWGCDGIGSAREMGVTLLSWVEA